MKQARCEPFQILELEPHPASLFLLVSFDEAAKEQWTGICQGLLSGDTRRFLVGLAMNFQVRARLTELRHAIESGAGILLAIGSFLDDFGPWQQRLGLVDAYGGPLCEGLDEQVLNLGDSGVDAACNDFQNWATPSLRNGVLVCLLGALDACVQQN